MARTFTDASFAADVLKSDVPVLVDFWAPWCGPCKVLGPTIEEIAGEMDGKGVAIGKLNVDEHPQSAGNYGVMSIPTMIVFKGGQPVEQLVGAVPKQRILDMLARHM